jgi:hypothetical protein
VLLLLLVVMEKEETKMVTVVDLLELLLLLSHVIKNPRGVGWRFFLLCFDLIGSLESPPSN